MGVPHLLLASFLVLFDFFVLVSPLMVMMDSQESHKSEYLTENQTVVELGNSRIARLQRETSESSSEKLAGEIAAQIEFPAMTQMTLRSGKVATMSEVQ